MFFFSFFSNVIIGRKEKDGIINKSYTLLLSFIVDQTNKKRKESGGVTIVNRLEQVDSLNHLCYEVKGDEVVVVIV